MFNSTKFLCLFYLRALAILEYMSIGIYLFLYKFFCCFLISKCKSTGKTIMYIEGAGVGEKKNIHVYIYMDLIYEVRV